MDRITGRRGLDGERLNRLDADLRREADEFLLGSGLGRIISAAGYVPVGSYVMRTMVWRDLDFERMMDEPGWEDHWALGQVFEATGWCWRLSCVDAYRNPTDPNGPGYYWGLRASDPKGGPTWKFDLWTARPEEFAPALERRAKWMDLLTEENRLDILAIKEVVHTHAEYGKTLLSVHVYEAVLEHGIANVEDFLAWWSAGRSLREMKLTTG